MSEETPEAALTDGDELFEHHRIVADKGQRLPASEGGWTAAVVVVCGCV